MKFLALVLPDDLPRRVSYHVYVADGLLEGPIHGELSKRQPSTRK